MLNKKSFKYLLSSALACLFTYTASSEIAALSEQSAKPKDLQQPEEKNAKNSDAYTILKEKGFAIDKKNNLVLDLFKENNLEISLKNGLEFILNSDNTHFLDSKLSLNEKILQNPLLKDCVENTIKYMETSSDPQDTKQFNILKRLAGIKQLIKIDESIPETNLFYKFVSSMKDAYQVQISRKIAADMLEANRGKAEDTLGTQYASQGGTIATGIATSGINIGIEAGVSNTECASEKSFYKIDSSGNAKVYVGAGFFKYLSANVGCSIGATRTLVFHSLEQFLDSYSRDVTISTVELREPDIKKISKSRKEMKDAEKQLLSSMQNSISSYLKISEIIPQNVKILLPVITNSEYAESQTSVNLESDLHADASCLAELGMDVSFGTQAVDTSMRHSYIKLLKKDCSASKYAGNSSKIIDFLKQENNKKYIETKTNLESFFNDEIKSESDKQKVLSMITSNIIGDLKQYNSSLSILADKTSTYEDKKYARKLKGKIESNWLPPHRLLKINRGRLEILKTAISLAAYLKEQNKTNKNLKLFEGLYNEINTLSKMQIFSKNLLKQNPNFRTSRTTTMGTVNGKTYFKIPVVGTGFISINYSKSNGEASFDNSEDIVVEIQLPMTGDKLLGENSIRSKFKELIEKLSENKNSYFSDACKETLGVIDTSFSNILEDLGIKTVISIPTVLSTKKYTNLSMYLTKVEKNKNDDSVIPLPGDDLAIKKDKDKWILKNIKRVDSSLTKLKIGIDKYTTTNISNRIGKSSSKIGPDTLSFIINKYNALAAGFSENSSETNPMWDKFTSSQKEQLEILFENINKEDSNVRYELQNLFNNTLKNVSLTETDYTFTKLMAGCLAYSREKTEENFEKALTGLNKLLNLNLTANYLPELDKIYIIN